MTSASAFSDDGAVPTSTSAIDADLGGDPSLPPGERIPAVGADDPPVSASSMPDVFSRVLNNPVADRAKEAAASAATAFNERVMPTANTAASEIRTGWQTKVMPGLTTGGAKVASFFGAVSDRVRETNSRLRAENETFRKVGDGISVRAATTMETLRDGTRELRVGVAELITPGGPPPRSHAGASNRASEPAPGPGPGLGLGPAHARPSSAPVHHTPSTPAPEDPGAVLGVPLDAVAAWDAHAAPVPRVILAATHWLSAAGSGSGPGPGPAPFLVDGDPAKVDAIVASLASGPGGLVPSGAAPEDVAGAIKAVLRSLPEPLLSFSLHAAVVQAGEEGSDVAYVAELAALLPPTRRATLTCVLAALARVAETHAGSVDVAALARAVSPCVAWPRSGKPDEDALRAFAEGKDDGGKTARELRAVANALEHLIEKHPAGFA